MPSKRLPLNQARRGDIRLILLAVLAKQSHHGYGIIRHLEEKSNGAWRPSAGVIYPMLQQLEEDKFLIVFGWFHYLLHNFFVFRFEWRCGNNKIFAFTINAVQGILTNENEVFSYDMMRIFAYLDIQYNSVESKGVASHCTNK